MKLITTHTTRTQAFAQTEIKDLYHPEGYWSLETQDGSYLSSLDELPLGRIECHKKAQFNWESHTGITGGKILVKSAMVLMDDEYEGPVLIVDGYLTEARLSTPYDLEFPPNFSTGNVNGVYANWEDFLYTGSCTQHDDPISQELLDHINKVIALQNHLDALKASFGR